MPRMIMSTLVFGVFCFTTVPAIGANTTIVSKVAISGVPVQVAFVFVLHPDCSNDWGFTANTSSGPLNGKITIKRGIGYPNVSSINRLSNCAYRKTQGLQVFYQSNNRYVGSDKVILDVIFPDGSEWIDQINITVK